MKRLTCLLLATALALVLSATIAAAAEESYFVWDSFGGDWADAEKTPATWSESSLLCWAATSSNILEWTGWGFVPGPFNDTDAMFTYYQANWTNQGTIPYYAWNWWFDGTLPPDDAGWAQVDGSGGNFWPGYVFTTYSSYVTTNIMQSIDGWLRSGHGVGIWISSANMEHEITVWGFNFDPAIDPAIDPAGYYKGVWVTDSDDDDNTNTPPDTLRYYPIAWNAGSGIWETTGPWYWWIKQVDALAVFPDTSRPVAAAGTYNIPEGSPVVFDGSGSSDADGDVLTYRWDYENDRTYDTEWSIDPTASKTWMDDYTGEARVQVFDGHLRDIDIASVTVYNVPPVVDAGSDQTVAEADEVSFTGSATDPGDDELTYEWDFGDGATASGSLTPKHTYGDDGVFTVTLTVSDDDGGVTSDTLDVTVTTVDPVVTPIVFAQPNGEFILAQVHELAFSTSSTDVGSDDAVYLWDFGDGETMSATYFNNGTGADPYPSPDVNPMSSSDAVTHTYAAPGDYTVTVTVTDDDGGAAAQSYAVHVADTAEALAIANDYVQTLPASAFKDKADSRKIAVDKTFGALGLMLAQNNYKGVIQLLNNNLRAASDGSLGGEIRDDWIIDPAAQAELCQMIDDITAYLMYLSKQ